MRYRILVQNRNENDKHISHITFETDDINSVVERVKITLKNEIEERQRLFLEFLLSNKKDYVQEFIDTTPEDLIDWKSKGYDISKHEFLENEMWFDKNV